jgi:hypothetical protein
MLELIVAAADLGPAVRARAALPPVAATTRWCRDDRHPSLVVGDPAGRLIEIFAGIAPVERG